jgi:hypothetical protein
MKTVTMRVDDTVYQMIKLAAQGQKRNISNFIEYATTQYLTSSEYIENTEMEDILKDDILTDNLKSGFKDLKMGIIQLSDFKIAETKTFEKVKKHIDIKLYTKIKNIVYPQLRLNPFYGNYRLFYFKNC